MKYIDSGSREVSQAFGSWLQDVLRTEVSEIRWQTGFFSADSIGVLDPALRRLASSNSMVRALIGSNDQTTSRLDLERLVSAVQLPREEAEVGVVAFRNGFFHPKTFHVRRADGSQASYVGSANLTGPGVSGLHVEAGITIDSRDGDDSNLLDTIALAVDSWFDQGRSGFYRVNGLDDVKELTELGVLCDEVTVKRNQSAHSNLEGAAKLHRLQPLFDIPIPSSIAREPRIHDVPPAAVRKVILPSVPRLDFPQYLLFAPDASSPTVGVLALTGVGLPSGASGLIIRLNRDSARHFARGSGTANVSIPVATLGTFRFGMFNGKFSRPRAEFPLQLRYVLNDRIVGPISMNTGIMAYGFIPGESGHGDVRMVIPAGCRALVSDIERAHGSLPAPNDVAFLEWPTSSNGATLRLTFLDRSSELHTAASAMLNQAVNAGASLGGGACWLPEGTAPLW